jgi:hypothetical protein
VAFPNPCRSAAVLQFTLARTGPVTLSLFDAAGRRLGPVLRFEGMGSGRKEVRLDGSRWSAGRYFYRVQTEGGAASGSLLRIQ